MAHDEAKAIRTLVGQLYEAKALKFGEFTLKSGIRSPFYVDLRVIISYPALLSSVAEAVWRVAEERGLRCDSVCGVPYTALPIATLVAVNHTVPMLMKRKEAKTYGTKNLIEGHFQQGDKCIIIEDIVTSGTSVLETVRMLRNAGLVVTDAIVFLDRQQGGSENLAKEGITLHRVTDINTAMRVLLEEGKIDKECHQKTKDFLSACGHVAVVKPQLLNYRLRQSKNLVVQKLFEIMESKCTNLALAADFPTAGELLQMADQVGPHICVLKTHVDIIKDFDSKVGKDLVQLAEKHRFLIMEDRKFSDIGATVKQQYQGGIYQIFDWADIITVHSISGPDVINALKSAAAGKPRACLLVAQMSSSGNLIDATYTAATVNMAEENNDFVAGFIAQSRLVENPSLVHMMPGISTSTTKDALGQRYTSPVEAIERGIDILIVGRGITADDRPVEAARAYRDAGWTAYEKNVSRH